MRALMMLLICWPAAAERPTLEFNMRIALAELGLGEHLQPTHADVNPISADGDIRAEAVLTGEGVNILLEKFSNGAEWKRDPDHYCAHNPGALACYRQMEVHGPSIHAKLYLDPVGLGFRVEMDFDRHLACKKHLISSGGHFWECFSNRVFGKKTNQKGIYKALRHRCVKRHLPDLATGF